MSTVQVLLGDRSYPIRIRSDSLRDLGRAVAEELDARRVVVVTTPRVRAIHYATIERGLRESRLRSDRVEVRDGEQAKTLRTASRVYDQLLELGVDRRTLLVGVGGGALTDLAGFVASTFLRGLPLVQVPTTLLAQIDASVGGKTAVNHPRGKNLIGTFYQPRMVWIDPDVLKTLSARDLRSGIAELIKVAVLWDAEFFGWLEEEMEAVLALDRDSTTEMIARACGIKAEIVGLDEREAGLRSLLNFGHTLAHALENVGDYRRYRHGEAVSIGMVFAAHLSEKRGLCQPGSASRLRALLSRAGLPVEIPRWSSDREAYLRAISVDKKVQASRVGFVVLREIGRAEVLQLTPEEILEGAP
ncbi:MAG: 3-dehydroquinate synthase [Myxococcota bacterium]